MQHLDSTGFPTVGAILVASWGFEQTNVDAVQVVERRGKKSVRVRRLHVSPAGAHPFDGWSGTVAPSRDFFMLSHAPLTRVVKFGHDARPYVKIGDSFFRYTDEGAVFYRSTYA